MDPRDILPQEIWELVFDKVEDPQDWYNLYLTSPYFQEVARENRTTALFPQVLPHVLDYVGSGGGGLCDFLQLRLVSRHWKAGLDNILGVRSRRYYYFHHHSTRISSFLNKFETTYCGGNPFVGRFASFQFNYYKLRSEAAMAEYSLLATRLLEKFGAQLKSLEVEVCNTNFDNCVSHLQSCLRLVPNLDSLKVNLGDIHHRGIGDAGDEPMPPCIKRGSLPLLPNLKSILFTRQAGWRIPLDMLNALVRLICNPNSLQSVRTTGFPSALLNYPNLESADVLLDSVDDCSSLPSTPWPLSKLTVSHSFTSHGDTAPLFKCVGHFKDTLTSLHFRNKLGCSYPSVNLDLPRLTHLTIKEFGFMSLRFLARASLPSLEVLSIVANWPGSLGDLESKVSGWGLWGGGGLSNLAKIYLLEYCQERRNWRYFMRRHVATRRNKRFQFQGIEWC